MIKIILKDGLTCPFMFCDLCGERIEDALKGEYLIPELEEGEAGEPVIGHKQCTFAFEKKSDKSWGNMGLDTLFVYLINNHKVDYEKSRENTQFLAELF